MKERNELNHKSENTLEKKEAILTEDVKYLLLISKSKTNLFSSFFRQKIYFKIFKEQIFYFIHFNNSSLFSLFNAT